MTGYAGEAHITSADAGRFNAGICGSGRYVLNTGTKFEATVQSANLVTIGSGDAIDQGRHISIPANSYEEAPIQNGTTGMRRIDVIALRYEKNSQTGVESASLVVKKGTEAASNPAVPAVISGDILTGATVDEMPLYRVLIIDLTIDSVTPVFSVLPAIEIGEETVSSLSGSELIRVNQDGVYKSATPSQIFDSQKSSTWNGSSLVATNASGNKIYTPITVADYNSTKSTANTANQTASDALNETIVLNNKISNNIILSQSTIYSKAGNVCSGKTVASGQSTLLGTIICEGFYGLIVVNATWSGSTSGYRSMTVGDDQLSIAANPSAATRLQVISVVRGSTQGVEVYGQHNAGTNCTVTASYELVGIKQA